jgi:hypothetical protein
MQSDIAHKAQHICKRKSVVHKLELKTNLLIYNILRAKCSDAG